MRMLQGQQLGFHPDVDGIDSLPHGLNGKVPHN
jgi:hypothetical protein